MKKTTEEAVLTDGILNATPQVPPNQIGESNDSFNIKGNRAQNKTCAIIL